MCPYAHRNKFGRLECTIADNKGTGGKNPLCPYQRYCSKAMEWQLNNQSGTCGRRLRNGRES